MKVKKLLDNGWTLSNNDFVDSNDSANSGIYKDDAYFAVEVYNDFDKQRKVEDCTIIAVAITYNLQKKSNFEMAKGVRFNVNIETVKDIYGEPYGEWDKLLKYTDKATKDDEYLYYHHINFNFDDDKKLTSVELVNNNY